MLKCLPGTIAPHGDVHIGTLSSGLGGGGVFKEAKLCRDMQRCWSSDWDSPVRFQAVCQSLKTAVAY